MKTTKLSLLMVMSGPLLKTCIKKKKKQAAYTIQEEFPILYWVFQFFMAIFGLETKQLTHFSSLIWYFLFQFGWLQRVSTESVYTLGCTTMNRLNYGQKKQRFSYSKWLDINELSRNFGHLANMKEILFSNWGNYSFLSSTKPVLHKDLFVLQMTSLKKIRTPYIEKADGPRLKRNYNKVK